MWNLLLRIMLGMGTLAAAIGFYVYTTKPSTKRKLTYITKRTSTEPADKEKPIEPAKKKETGRKSVSKPINKVVVYIKESLVLERRPGPATKNSTFRNRSINFLYQPQQFFCMFSKWGNEKFFISTIELWK